MSHHFKLILFCTLHCIYSIDTCDDGFILCATEGFLCSTNDTAIIAYGIDNRWSYYKKTGGQDISCSDSIFGDPYPTNSNPKQCCKQIKDLSGSSGLSPVVNTIYYNGSFQHYFQGGSGTISTYYWKLIIPNFIAPSFIFDNCASVFDTKLWVQNAVGTRISDSVCDGDDCGICSSNIYKRERFTLDLIPGIYYLELSRFSTSDQGIYSLIVSAAPTISPTMNPTINLYPKQSCGSNKYCYYVQLYPLPEIPIKNTVSITNEDTTAETRFEIHYNIRNNNCRQPSISFAFEEIDWGQTNEYIDLIDNDGSSINRCIGNLERNCGVFMDCFSSPQMLSVNTITKDSNYTLTVVSSTDLHALCTHSYEINARLTIYCLGDTVSPTTDPTFEPSFQPTFFPSSIPSQEPSMYPTNQPSSQPTTVDPNTFIPTTVPDTFSPTIFTSTLMYITTHHLLTTYDSTTIDNVAQTEATVSLTGNYYDKNSKQKHISTQTLMLFIAALVVVVFIFVCIILMRRKRINRMRMKNIVHSMNNGVEIAKLESNNIAHNIIQTFDDINRVKNDVIHLETDLGVNEHHINNLIPVKSISNANDIDDDDMHILQEMNGINITGGNTDNINEDEFIVDGGDSETEHIVTTGEGI
eukprot:138082_1